MLKLDPYVTDILLRDLVGHDRRPASFLVYIWLTAEQQRRGTAVEISYQDLAESIGISKSSAQSAVGLLIRRKLLAVSKATVTATPIYKVLTPWTADGWPQLASLDTPANHKIRSKAKPGTPPGFLS